MPKKHDDYPGAERFMPATRSLAAMRRAVQSCRGCPLYKFATQAVFGRGKARPAIMLIGEQPGNDEDLAGEPFVGPAGRVLHEALVAADIPHDAAYVTNIVKHFKFERAGKRRLHKRPTVAETNACKPWLEGELAAVQPHIVVLLGATAAQAMLGRNFRVTQRRGEVMKTDLAPVTIATVHPSSVLRQRTSAERAAAKAAFVADLRVARKALASRRTAVAGPPSASARVTQRKTWNKANLERRAGMKG